MENMFVCLFVVVVFFFCYEKYREHKKHMFGSYF